MYHVVIKWQKNNDKLEWITNKMLRSGGQQPN